MHHDFDKIIELTNEYGLTVITTNGFLLEKYFDTIMKSNIRQINISPKSDHPIDRKAKAYLDTVIYGRKT